MGRGPGKALWLVGMVGMAGMVGMVGKRLGQRSAYTAKRMWPHHTLAWVETEDCFSYSPTSRTTLPVTVVNLGCSPSVPSTPASG